MIIRQRNGVTGRSQWTAAFLRDSTRVRRPFFARLSLRQPPPPPPWPHVHTRRRRKKELEARTAKKALDPNSLVRPRRRSSRHRSEGLSRSRLKGWQRQQGTRLWNGVERREGPSRQIRLGSVISDRGSRTETLINTSTLRLSRWLTGLSAGRRITLKLPAQRRCPSGAVRPFVIEGSRNRERRADRSSTTELCCWLYTPPARSLVPDGEFSTRSADAIQSLALYRPFTTLDASAFDLTSRDTRCDEARISIGQLISSCSWTFGRCLRRADKGGNETTYSFANTLLAA